MKTTVSQQVRAEEVKLARLNQSRELKLKNLEESTKFKLDKNFKLGDYYKNNPDCFNDDLDEKYVKNLDLSPGMERRSNSRKFGTRKREL